MASFFDYLEMLKDLLVRAWNKLLSMATKFVVFAWLNLMQFVLYALLFIGGMLILDSLARNEPSLNHIWHMINMFNAMLAFMISTLTGNWPMMALSGQALIGHVLVGFLDTLLTPFWLVFSFFNLIFTFILDDVAFHETADGVVQRGVPADCNGNYPDYNIGHIYGIAWVFAQINSIIDQFISILEYEIVLEPCVSDIIGEGGWQDNPLTSWMDQCGTFIDTDVKGMFGLSLLHEWLGEVKTDINNIRDADLVPASFFETILGAVGNAISFVAGDYSGTDAIKHYLYINRIEFDGNDPITPGSKPFDGFLEDKVAGIFGCN